MDSQDIDWKQAAWTAARKRYPDLVELIDLEEGLYAAQRSMADFIANFEMVDEARVRAAWAEGNPAFNFDTLRIQMGAFAQVVAWLGGLVVTATDPMFQGEASQRVEQLAHADWNELGWLARAVYEGESQGDFEDNLVASALKPFMWQAWKAVQPLFKAEEWPHGHCPNCGAGPDFATLGEAGNVRMLYCSRCDSPWQFGHVGCPFCGNRNQRSLYYHPTDDEFYQLYICGECKRYLKTVDVGQVGRPILLSLDRVATYRVDQAANEYGFR